MRADAWRMWVEQVRMSARPAPPVRHPYEGGVSWAFMRYMDIPDSDDPSVTYLRRFIWFKTPLLALYTHDIYLPDKDRWLHNHPFGFLSYMLSGTYVEQRQGKHNRERRKGSFAFTSHKDFHRIINIVGSVRTLVLAGPRRQEWGFNTAEGFKTWREVKGEERVQS
jgi:hypothetical protein